MRYLLFDVETTGLSKRDEVIQFSGFLLNNNFKNIEKVVNFYCMSDVPISSRAREIHHIGQAELRRLSDSKTFEEYYYEMPDIFDNVNNSFISYNTDFDTRMTNQTLENNGIKKFNFPQVQKYLEFDSKKPVTFCLMKGCASFNGIGNSNGVSRRNVEMFSTPEVKSYVYNLLNKNNALSKIGIKREDEEETLKIYNKFYTQKIAKDTKTLDGVFTHNALYDVFMSWTVLLTYLDRMMI